MVKNNKQKVNIEFQTIGELFCGPGGGGLGASYSSLILENKTIRMRHLWATDYDEDSCNTYKENIERYETNEFKLNQSINVVNNDINNLDLDSTGPFETVDGLLFGFPCNDFSIVGESKGTDGKYGPLYKHGIRILNRKDKPNWFIAENVGGITSANEGKAFSKILGDMVDAGYDIVAHKYKFEDYGIPQNRHRIIVVGFKRNLKILFRVPKPSFIKMSVGEALSNIPPEASHQELTQQSKQVIERLNYIKPGQNAWNATIPAHLQLNVPNSRLSHIYRRLEKDKPAYTLTGSGGGGTHMYHWEEPRALTNRERARIQTFPDNYNFTGSKESVRKQLGMAIPPKGMEIVCNALLKSLFKVEFEHIAPNINIHEILSGQNKDLFDN